MSNRERAFCVKRATTFHRVIRHVVTAYGEPIDEVEGKVYGAGEYVFSSELTERDLERFDRGELDTFLVEVDVQDAVDARNAVETQVFIPEHEVERYNQLDVGHEVVEKDQLLQLKSQGAQNAREALDHAKEVGRDQRPQITEQPSFQEKVVDSEVLARGNQLTGTVEQVPGVPVGDVLEAAEQDPEVDTIKRARRGRPPKRSE